jgi:uncharacterized protein (TIGR02996 family)
MTLPGPSSDEVLAAPDDDAPRLVLADFLTTRGDPRGEFITLQCRLAAAKDDDARRKLRIAENKLLAAHGAQWTQALLAAAPAATPLRANKLVFHRGFLEEAALPLSALDDLEPYFTAAPLLRRLRFDAPQFLGEPLPPPSLTGRLGSPRLRGLRALDLLSRRVETPRPSPSPRASSSRASPSSSSRRPRGPRRGFTFFIGSSAAEVLTAVGARARSAARRAQAPRAGDERDWLRRREGARRGRLAARAPRRLDEPARRRGPAGPRRRALARRAAVAGGRRGDVRPRALEALAKSKGLAALERLQLDGAAVGAKSLAAFLGALALPRLTCWGCRPPAWATTARG